MGCSGAWMPSKVHGRAFYAGSELARPLTCSSLLCQSRALVSASGCQTPTSTHSCARGTTGRPIRPRQPIHCANSRPPYSGAGYRPAGSRPRLAQARKECVSMRGTGKRPSGKKRRAGGSFSTPNAGARRPAVREAGGAPAHSPITPLPPTYLGREANGLWRLLGVPVPHPRGVVPWLT